MYTARKLRKSNVCEYLLYMWGVEDLIRAHGLDLDRLREGVLSQYSGLSAEQHAELEAWYGDLIAMMRRERKEDAGHVAILTLLCNDIYNFHLTLLANPAEGEYQRLFQSCWPDVELLQSKVEGVPATQHVELALTALHLAHLLKLRGDVVLADTVNALRRLAAWLKVLSEKYLEEEKRV